ncbi:AsmA family protein [Castellaniella caeni]|uniref:AsmA family protein n=1 Tax=Castellaniella caeni TaxID=266123 RepID=UPI000C9FBEA4|nr:AsmA family protein [Castellaniella caeni]
MNVWLKRGLSGLVLALLVAIVGLAIFLLTFNPNAYKSRLEQYVFDHYARTLTIRGDIGLSLFPRIGLSVSEVALSNRKSADTFVSVDSARFAVAIWPLLSNELVVDHVAITGLKAWVVRDAQGRFNFNDLIESEQTEVLQQHPGATGLAAPAVAAAAAPLVRRSDLNIDIAGLELKGGQIRYIDLKDGLATTLSDIEANTGRVTYDQPFDVSLKARVSGDDPVQDARLQAQALLRLDPASRSYSAQKINVQLTGRLGNLDQATAALKGSLAYKGSEYNFAANNLELAVNGDIVGAHPVQGLKTSLSAAQLRLDRRNQELKVAKLALRAAGQDAGHQLELALDAPALSISPTTAQADPVAGTFKWTGDDTLAVSLGLEGLSGNANEWQFRTANLDGALTQGERLLRLKLTSPVSWNTSLRKGALSAIKGDVSVRDPRRPQATDEFPMIGGVHLDLVKDALDVDLNAVIDGGQAALKSSATRLANPQIHFALTAEKFDLNHWLPQAPKPAPAQDKPAPSTDTKADKPAEAAPERKPEAAPAPDRPTAIDLAFLKGQDIEGDVKIGDLRIRDVQLTQLATPVLVRQGVFSLPKLTAKLYDGTLDGQFQAGADQTLGLKLNLDKVAVAPLLQAALGRNLLAGRGAAQIDVKTQGKDIEQWQRALAGRLAWQIRDGAVLGVDAGRTLSDAASTLGDVLKGRLGAVPSVFDKQRQTPFSTLDGRLDLKDGRGTLSRLLLVSSLVRVTAGKPALIDIPDQSLDVRLLAQVAARPPKELAGSLGALLGVTLPVRIAGAWTHPDYQVEWGAVHNQSIQQAVKSGLMDLMKGRDLLNQVLPVPDTEAHPAASGAPRPSSSTDPVERIGNALKGLLGQ